MAGKKQPYGINNVVSWGATVVIIGLLFKIQHWPYGGFFISLGLGMEAFLFLILGFQRDSTEIDWRRAYPELDEDYKGELPTAASKGIGDRRNPKTFQRRGEKLERDSYEGTRRRTRDWIRRRWSQAAWRGPSPDQRI